MKNICHVGLPKTGTTYLQRRYFPKSKNYNVVTSDEIFHPAFHFIYALNKNYDCAGIPFRRRRLSGGEHNIKARFWAEEVRRYRGNDKRPLLLSCEGLVGVSFAPIRNIINNALIIREVLSTEKVIFVFRKQHDYAESLYRQMIFEEDRFGNYIEPIDFISVNSSSCSLSSSIELNWLYVYQSYCSVFGVENVLALPYELMKSDFSSFSYKISEFIGEKISLEDEDINSKERISKKISYYPRNKNLQFEKFSPVFKKQLIEQHFSSNKMLSFLIGIDLSLWGYHDAIEN